MKHKLLLILSALLIGMFITACKSTGAKPTSTLDLRVIHTQVAGTLIAQRTHDAGEEAIAKLTEIAKATATSQVADTSVAPTSTTIPASPSTPMQVGTATPLPTATATPTQAPTATSTTPPTNTPIPPTPIPPTSIPATSVPAAPTAKPVPCNWATVVKDISVPDGTVFIAGNEFTKTWRIQNIGTCKWTTAYAIVYQSGELMGADKAIYMDDVIEPGETVDISITFIAPSAEGSHTGYWRLRNQSGNTFGIGSNADDAFWVKIKVANPTGVAYNFSNHICDAEWRTKDGQILCNSDSVERVESPKLETGKKDDEVAIVVHPSDGKGGYITGKFPQRKILAGDWFRVKVGCLYDNPKCKVTFKLSYQVGGGDIQTLGTWKQTYDGEIQNIDIDLSFLADKRVVFIFTVQNNDSSEGDWVFWLHPRIAR
jgi:hypothetical protein